MSRHHPVYPWAQTLARELPELTRPQVLGLALWSYGLLAAGSCALTAVTAVLTATLSGRWHSLRSRLKDFYRPAAAKHGPHRRDWDVTVCFPRLLAWVLRAWPTPQLALALDATSLADRFSVLVLSVVYRGGAIPVAWQVLPANVPHPWQPEWRALLQAFHARLPPTWSGTVVVLADRGLYARWLFEAIVALGWHPLLRITRRGTFRPAGWQKAQPVAWFAAAGSGWQGRGTAFPRTPERRLECTLLVLHAAGHAAGWYVLTDLAPQAAAAAWYGLRCGIEAGFRQLKRGGWHWQRTRMRDPQRVARLWLALAVAACYVQSHAAAVAGLFPRRLRLVSGHRRGLAVTRAQIGPGGRRMRLGAWSPWPWPTNPPGVIVVPWPEHACDPPTRNPPQ